MNPSDVKPPTIGYDADDAMVSELKRANRRPFLVGLAGVAGVAIGAVLYVFAGRSATESELERLGYTNVSVQMKGPFTFSFSGTKGAAKCSGSYERVPFSTSMSEGCVTTTPPPPPISTRVAVERSLAKKHAEAGFSTFTCPEISSSDRAVRCNASSTNGSTLPFDVKASGTGDDVWESWTFAPKEIYFDGEQVAQKLSESLPSELAKKGKRVSGFAVDCGKGPQVTRENVSVCKATAGKAEGKLEIKMDDAGKLEKWTLTGI